MDALGRTIEADEPDGSGSLTVATCYQYDANGNLLQVVAPTGQSRSYAYDGLGRVTTATTPESGTTTYSYDGNGDLASKTDARSITTSYTYDNLHRLTAISYSDSTPSVNYFYDQTTYNGLTIANGKGRRTGMSDGSGATAWSYDTMGRVVTEKKTITGVTKTISYSYNLDGSVASITYPDGRIVNYTYSNAERPLTAQDGDGTNYVIGLGGQGGASYWPQGALHQDLHGYVSGGFGGITESWGYNNDLEPNWLNASSSNGTVMNLGPNYSGNGSVVSIGNSLDSGRNESMTYDPLNRLLTAQTQATLGQDCWGLNFGSGGLADDVLGNLLSMSPSKCSGPNLSVSVNAKNQITNTGFSYDNAGNLTADGQYSYAYNAENEITSANSVSYTYDGDGLRVKKSSGTLYWRSVTGQVIEETDTSGNMTSEVGRDYIFFAGRRIAWRDSSGSVYYYFVDMLGSTRVVTDSSGNTCFNADYYPYGQENDYSTSCSPRYKFTGYEYDSETGNYYACAVLRSASGAVHEPRPLGRGGWQPAVDEWVRLRAEQSDDWHGSHWIDVPKSTRLPGAYRRRRRSRF